MFTFINIFVQHYNEESLHLVEKLTGYQEISHI